MKKLILFIFILFWFINISYASTHSSPQFHLIENNVSSQVTNLDFYILPDNENANQFCIWLNQELINYSTWSTISEKKAFFDNTTNTWKDTNSDYSDYISYIECSPVLDNSFTIYKPKDYPKKVMNWESLFEFWSALIKENFWTYDWLDSEDFTTQNNWIITWIITTSSWYLETVELDVSWISENPQTKQLMLLLYDIRLILSIFLWFWLFFKFYEYLSKFFYFLR